MERALAVTEQASLSPEDLLRWLNRHRPVGAPELTEPTHGMTPERQADAFEELFHEQVRRAKANLDAGTTGRGYEPTPRQAAFIEAFR